jgi:fatty acid desaturase
MLTMSMVPAPALLAPARATERIRPDGRPTPEFREQLRRIPSWRNALSVMSMFLQTAAVLWAAVTWGPWTWPVAFVLMGRAHAQMASLMHEAAHRLLFTNRTANDVVGRWLLGYPAFTPTDAYRRVHMAHHRREFGPDEPDRALYDGYPISRESLRRKLLRDATGRTGWKLVRLQLSQLRGAPGFARTNARRVLATQLVLLAAAIASGYWWLYPVFWLAPYLTVWRVINRLRSIAEHGGMQESDDRRATTHSVRQQVLARVFLVPFHIGWHLAHHVDAGVPFRNLPHLHEALREAGYVTEQLEHRNYLTLWRRLAAG